MLKISVKQQEPEKKVLLEVEGRLAGPWVEELERCWENERKRVSSERIVVKLSNVSFIDDAGRELLGKISHAGSKLEGHGCMVRAIIARIIGAVFSARDCEDESEGSIAAHSEGSQGGRE
jgi:anti-anti-sigma regulatory factor